MSLKKNFPSNFSLKGDDLTSRSNLRNSDASSDEFNAPISMAPDGGSSSSKAASTRPNGAAGGALPSSPRGDISRESTESPSPRNYPSSIEGTPRGGSPGRRSSL